MSNGRIAYLRLAQAKDSVLVMSYLGGSSDSSVTPMGRAPETMGHVYKYMAI